VGLRYIKKGLADLPVQLGSRVSKSRAHVPKMPDVSAIMGLQDASVGYTFNAYKTCGQAAHLMPTRRAHMRLQYNANPVDHSQGTTTVLGDAIGRSHVAGRV
jgi:hypothetical protein